MLNGKKIVVVMPAYNAEKTLEKTYNEIFKEIVDEIILTDDAKSWDFGYPSTVEMADGTLFTLWYENPGRAAKLRMLRWKIEE